MSGHTPGPWALRIRHTSKEGEHYELTAIDGRLRGMAYIYSSDEDAHVMCAAPDLLEAAEKVIEMNRQHAEDQYGDANKAETWSCVIVLRAAIARAKGEM